MAEGRGVDALFSMQLASVWGTAVDCDVADRGFRAKTWSWTETVEELPDMGLNADAFNRQTTDTGRYLIEGEFTVDMKYEGLHRHIAGLWGSAAVTGAGPYRHNITWNNDLEGIFYTLCWYDGQVVNEVDSVKIRGVTWSTNAGRRVEMTVRWVGRRRTEPTAGTNVDLSTSLTEPSNVNFVQFLNSTQDYQIVAQGGALADFELMNWTVNVDREIDTGDKAYTTTNAPWMREPRAGAATCTGSLQIPHTVAASAHTYLTTAINAGTIYEAKFNTIETAVTREFGIWVPSLKFVSGTANPDGKGQIPQILNWVGEHDSAGTSSWSAPIDTTHPSLQFYNADATAALS